MTITFSKDAHEIKRIICDNWSILSSNLLMSKILDHGPYFVLKKIGTSGLM